MITLTSCGVIFRDKDRAVLDVSLGDEPLTMDPARAWDDASIDCVRQMFLGLTAFDAQKLEVVPELAERWEISENGLTWTFYLRQDVLWVQYNSKNDVVEKRPVTASDVVYGIKRSLDPTTAADYAYLLYVVEGAQAANRGTASLNDVGVKAIDEYIVEFTLEKPASYFPVLVAAWVTYPQPREAIEANGDKWTRPDNVWTNGPFLLKERKRYERVTWVKNPLYYDAENVHIDEVRAAIVPDDSIGLAMYENDELDTYAGYLGTLSANSIEHVKSSVKLSGELRASPALCTYYYGFVNAKPPFDNHLVRKAFSAALDRSRLIDEVIGEAGTPATSFAGPGIFGNTAHNPAIGIGSDCERAKAYLAEAGYPDGAKFPEVTLMHNTSEKQAQMARAAQRMWTECLSVTVRVEDYEWVNYLKRIQHDAPLEDTPHIFRLTWCANYPDQHNGLHEEFHAEASGNFLRRAPGKFDELTAQAAGEIDAAQRRELYKQAEYELNNVETAIAPLYHYTNLSLVKPWITCDAVAWGGRSFKDCQVDVEMKRAARKR